MIRKLIIMFCVASLIASYLLWTIAAAWLASPRGVLLAVGGALAVAWDWVSEGGMKRL